MLRGYRGIILAFGLILAGAQQPTKQSETQSGAQQQQATPAPTPSPTEPAKSAYRPYPGYNPDPCYNAGDHDTADLCAQWRAALAAEKAAHEARRATSWAIIAAILSFIGVSGLVYTIWQTNGALAEARRGNRLSLLFERRSRREARENAETQNRALAIADKQFSLSEKSAKAQLRAYLAVTKIVPYQIKGDNISVKVFVKNVGQTPARIARVTQQFWMSSDHSIDPFGDGPEPRIYFHFIDFLAQGSEVSILAVCADASNRDRMNENDQADVFAYGRIEFLDVFGDPHWMQFAFAPTGWGFENDTEFRACVHGNDSD